MDKPLSKYIILFLFLFPVLNAHASIDWGDSPFTTLNDNVNTVKSNVSTITGKVTGNISTVADQFKSQIDLLQSQGLLVKETAEQLLDWLNDHKEDYVKFASPGRCGAGSPCDIFREELRTFVQNFSSLSDRFPVVDKLGLSDAPVLTRLLDKLPPIILFPIYETMSRMPDWNKLPEQLASIYDEIADPDVFSVRLSPLSVADTSGFAATAYTTASFTTSASTINTPTERFCESHTDRLDKGIDPVRLNRIKLFISYLKAVFDIIGEVPPKDQNLELVGEGGSLPIPNAFKMIVHAINFIQDAVQTYRNNIQICRDLRNAERDRNLQLEIQVAQCLQLADFVLPGTRDDIYDLVTNKVNVASQYGLPVDSSLKSIRLADNFRAAGMWKSAYLKLCDAYKKIGE